MKNPNNHLEFKAKLSNNDFTNKAPQEVVEGARHQLLENEAQSPPK